MALQSSGTISFANLQTEFGGSNPITMGEYASFRQSGSGNTISMNQFYGASASFSHSLYSTQAYMSGTMYFGRTMYNLGSSSITPDSFLGGTATMRIWTQEGNGGQWAVVYVSEALPNSGWTTVTIAGQTHQRASASFRSVGGGRQWQWYNPINRLSTGYSTVVFA